SETELALTALALLKVKLSLNWVLTAAGHKQKTLNRPLDKHLVNVITPVRIRFITYGSRYIYYNTFSIFPMHFYYEGKFPQNLLLYP
ncbi:hypothetical protein, partial [Colwellia sp. BRX8-3]